MKSRFLTLSRWDWRPGRGPESLVTAWKCWSERTMAGICPSILRPRGRMCAGPTWRRCGRALHGIAVRNLLDRKIGVVVAVDGRNIISGKKSWLGNSERM